MLILYGDNCLKKEETIHEIRNFIHFKSKRKSSQIRDIKNKEKRSELNG